MLLAACALLVAIPPASRAVIAGPVEPELWARILGQTSDLDWSVETQPRASEIDVLAWAASIDADAVLAIERRPLAWDVSLVGRARDRRLIRSVQIGDGDAAASSAREAVAVIVRGLLVAIALGAPVALESSEVVWTPYLMVGAEGSWAGAALGAVRARGGLRRWPWSLALSVVSGPAVALDDGRTVLSLARHAVAVHGGAVVELDASWSLSAAVGVGAAAFQRGVVVRDPTLVGSAPRLRPSFLGSIEGGLTWWSGSVGVELSVGLDVVPGAPQLVYRIGEQVVERTAVGVFEPRLAVSLVLGR